MQKNIKHSPEFVKKPLTGAIGPTIMPLDMNMDIDSLKKWRDNLLAKREEIEQAISDCDRMLRQFAETNPSLIVPTHEDESEQEFRDRDLRECVIEILKRYKEDGIKKEDIKKELAFGGFWVNTPKFDPTFWGHLGSMVKKNRATQNSTSLKYFWIE